MYPQQANQAQSQFHGSRLCPLLAAEGLTKRLGKVRAVDGIDLQVADGERIAVFGPNGAGKSTLLRLIAGLLRPTSGRVAIDGREPRAVRGSLGYLGHEPFLYGYLTAAENLEFFADLYGVGRHRGRSTLERVGMAHKAGARVNELSQGETQRVALARALLHEPGYLLLDEPFSNLDGQAADLVQTLVGEPGRTVLLVTHDRRRALEICDRSISMKMGRVIEEGRGSESSPSPIAEMSS